MAQREPSIHITRSNLKNLLRKYHDYEDHFDDQVDELVDFLMLESRKISLEKRSVNITNSTFAKKVINKITNDKTDISLLAQVIHSVRLSLKHKGIKPITNESSEWSTLKKLTTVINEFCQSFDLDKREGYIEYVKIGLSRITSFRGYLTKLYDMSEVIASDKDARVLISNDPNKDLTLKIHDYYVGSIAKNTGLPENYTNNPTKYLTFLKVSELVIKNNVNYRTFIDAQFEGLEWANTYPDTSQLITEKAIERLNKFLFTKGKDNLITEQKEKDDNVISALKRLKNNVKKDKSSNRKQ